MTRLVSSTNSAGFNRIELEDAPEGTYIFVYERPGSEYPERDYLQDSLAIAQECCRDDFGVPLSSWSPVDAPEP